MNPKISELSLVVVGNINPVIIQPFWLAHKGLIQEAEAESANISIIHEEVVKFDLEWASIEAQKNRMQIRTAQEASFVVIKDLLISIFNTLKNTPLNVLGINHIRHFEVNDEQYLEIGKRLAPFENWDGLLRNPRLFELIMGDLPRKDGNEGHYKIRIAPSELIQRNGVSININDHFSTKSDKINSSGEIIDLLSRNFETSLKKANFISEKLWENLNL